MQGWSRDSVSSVAGYAFDTFTVFDRVSFLNLLLHARGERELDFDPLCELTRAFCWLCVCLLLLECCLVQLDLGLAVLSLTYGSLGG